MGRLKKNKDAVIENQVKEIKSSRRTVLKSKKADKIKKNEKQVESFIEEDKQIESQTIKKDKINFHIDAEQFRKGIKALLQYEEKSQSKELYSREKPVFLQIDAIKIPHCPSRRIRLPLKHTLVTDSQEVCLIVPDLKKGRRIDHEPTIEHYEDLLRSQNIRSIKRIIPIRQLRVEYDQFELKRRLCGYYDHFLVAGNISGHVLHILGKTFIERRKIPIPISLESKKLADNIEKALKKVALPLHGKGATFMVQFGHTEMTVNQLTENLLSVTEKLTTHFPGEWANIRSLHIKTDKSISIPVYYTLKNANKVNVPVIKPLRPKLFEKVTGELTTRLRNNVVTVHPGGRIEYEKKTTGITKNQLRKIRQGKIQKRSARLRAKSEKLKTKKDKVKKEIKQESLGSKIVKERGKSLDSKNQAKKNKKKNKNGKKPVINSVKLVTNAIKKEKSSRKSTLRNKSTKPALKNVNQKLNLPSKQKSKKSVKKQNTVSNQIKRQSKRDAKKDVNGA